MKRALALACAAWACACAPTAPAPMTGVLRQANAPVRVYSLDPPYMTSSDYDLAKFGSALAVLESALGKFLVVGAPGFKSGAGAVFLYDVTEVSGGSVAFNLRQTLDAPTLPTVASGFGAALAVGDLNGDGQPELAVGAPSTFVMANGTAGAVFVYSPSAGGGLDATAFTTFLADSPDGRLGSSLAFAHFGARTFLFAGAPGGGVDKTFIFPVGNLSSTEIIGGNGIAAIDFDGDGSQEVVTGWVPQSEIIAYHAALAAALPLGSAVGAGGLGAAIIAVDEPAGPAPKGVLAGTSSGTTPGEVRFYDLDDLMSMSGQGSASVTAMQSGSGFGAALGWVGPFGDDYGKFAVGAPDEGGFGAVHLYTTQLFPQLLELWPGGYVGAAAGGKLGAAMAGGVDLDGDGNVDFAAGAPGMNGGAGSVRVFLGTTPMACAAACSACTFCLNGACVPVPDDTPCAVPDFCSAAAACLAGTCTTTQKTCGTQACDPNRMHCVSGLWVFDDGATHAVVGQPYDYNPPANTLRTNGTPTAFFTCDGGPPGFDVDGGIVAWTPTSAGDVSICLGVGDGIQSDSFTYRVQVSPVPDAGFSVLPAEGVAPLQVVAKPDPLDPNLEWTWDFGDMSPLGFTRAPSHVYLMPGSYPVDVTAAVPQTALAGTARRFVTVLDSAHHRPPQAQIRHAGDVFACEPCTMGSAPITQWTWDFEDGAVTGPQVMRTFGPGRHRVRLTVTDANGLSGFDAMMLSVPAAGQQPPTCRLSVLPPAGNAPLTVQWSALEPAGVDGSVAPATPQTYDDVGRHPETLEVKAGGLTCVDFAWATALSEFGDPIVFTNQPMTELECGDAFSYAPAVTGARPVTFTLHGPAGATLKSGTVSWTAPSTAGSYRFDLAAQNAAGRTLDTFVVNVSCGDTTVLPDGGTFTLLDFTPQACGCGAGGGSLLWLGVLATLRRLNRRR